MHLTHSVVLVLSLTLLLSGRLASQPVPRDTIDYYFDSTSISSSGTVTVTADRLKRPNITVDDAVYRSTIQRTDASDVAGIMYMAPAARVQVNSRGESNLYLRNAGERQVALFFDGGVDDQFVYLPPSTTLNSRLSWYSPNLGPASLFEVFARVNNLMNSVTLNQPGLPGSGREGRAGIRVTF
jgi:Arc/MetJ family transcription regulator